MLTLFLTHGKRGEGWNDTMLNGSWRASRGGACGDSWYDMLASFRGVLGTIPTSEAAFVGFRVASDIPEPATLSLLALGGVALGRRRQRQGQNYTHSVGQRR